MPIQFMYKMHSIIRSRAAFPSRAFIGRRPIQRHFFVSNRTGESIIRNSKRCLASSSNPNGMMEKVAKFFGMDEETRRRKAQEREIKKVVDTAFEGTGLVGKLWASIVKTFAVRVLGVFSSTMEDFGHIHKEAENALRRDKRVMEIFGNDVICDPPYSSAMTSSEIDGVSKKKISLMFDITGTNASGKANVTATVGDNGEVDLKQFNIALTTGEHVSVSVRLPSKSRQIIDV